MKLWKSMATWPAVVLIALFATGCQTQTRVVPVPLANITPPVAKPSRLAIHSPMAWGGQVRCMEASCRMAVVEHEKGALALYELKGRSSRLLDRQPLAYHPDSVTWLTDHLLAAAVEGSSGIDIFRLEQERLVREQQVNVGFAARDVIDGGTVEGRHRVLVTPYSGKNVAWVEWQEGKSVKVQKVHWCEAPWHPVRVSQLPKMPGSGYAVACLDGHRVIAVSDKDLLAPPHVLATFNVVARQTRPSPSGRWLYVALEMGGRNARIDMQTGELQWIQAPPTGAVSVAPLSDDTVIWGDDTYLYVQHLDPTGAVVETRWLKVSGFATGLQLQDIDGDNERDLVVYNSSPTVVDVIYGPLWAQAAKHK